MSSTLNSLASRAKAAVLHPYSDPLTEVEPLIMERGEGIRVWDSEGRSYIDAMAGLWCASLGFSEGRLAKAAYDQMVSLPYYHGFTGKSHVPMIELAERLLAMAPVPMGKVFFANSGSEANDTAIKLIWYYNNARGKPGKKKIIGRHRGYHGITLATTSVTGQVINHTSFDVPLNDRYLHVQTPDFYHAGLPGESEEDYATRCAQELENAILTAGPDTVAAMFMEPILGGGGLIVPPRTYYEKMQAVLRKYDVLVVADEVICGFGRTGNHWGSTTMGIQPDLLTCAKALTSGYLPLSALMISQEVVDGIASEAHRIGVLGHGFTYSGHPVPAAVALETLRIYDEIDIISHVRTVGSHLFEQLNARVGSHPLVGQVRGAGLLAGFEIVADKDSHKNFEPSRKVGPTMVGLCQKHGLIIRACPNDAIVMSPPLVITESEVDQVVDKFVAALNDLEATTAVKG
ncbi:aminotransferase [Devosia epidermidihirudinis]|uniref:Aminotransferase n=1 Tax=Devosia epidermidihirudinis TaxID=1293439 RepID=A0A0F5Q901_9HYPH|nr:aminotransferase [Devosia epidermidihirudinis]KKC37410.1 aminotransferase [Devosia epidermidihirudinis]